MQEIQVAAVAAQPRPRALTKKQCGWAVIAHIRHRETDYDECGNL